MVVVVVALLRFNFFLIAAFFVANAKDYHQQYPQLQQERRSIAGGFKRAARELHVIVKIRGAVVVILVHVWGRVVFCHGLIVQDSHSIFSFIFSILIVALFFVASLVVALFVVALFSHSFQGGDLVLR